MTEKLCIKCVAAPVYASPNRTYSYCKDCEKERKRAAYLANQDTARAKQRAYRERRNANPAEIACPHCGTTHIAKGADNWCRDCRAAYHRTRRADPAKKPRINAKQREWYQANREREREWRKRYRVDLKREALAAYGGTCACCGEHRWELLALDHIDGNGKEHRAQASAVGARFYSWLKRQGWPQGELRVLCHNCNLSRGLYGYCPHEREQAELELTGQTR